MTINLLSFASVLKTGGGLLLAVLILLVMVTIHEFGHYIAGRLLGFKINEFAVGFGPAIFKKRSKKTGVLFALRAVPLGGYCAFDGEDEDLTDKEEGEDEEKDGEDDEPFEDMKVEKPQNPENEGGRCETNENPSVTETQEDEEKNEEESTKKEDEYPEPQGAKFNDQAPWKRIIVLIAGATMNYLLALFLIILMFACVGRPVYTVVQDERFEEQTEQIFDGLQVGDTILEINGKTLYMLTDWQDALNGKKKGETVEVLVIREGKKQVVPVTLYTDASFQNMSHTSPIFYALGLVVNEEVDGKMQTVRACALNSQTVRDGFFQTIGNSFVYSFKLGGSVLRSLGELITGKLGIKAMGGPVTTISVTAEAATSGFASFLNIAALIGVNLAVFNLLPVPALDGCKVIFCIIEWIRKKPINRKVETIINLAGLVFLLGFAVLVDLLHFIL